MKRKRLIAAFLSLMLVVTVVMPAANALGTGTIELGPNEGTSATETPVEEPAEPETPVEEPTDPGASDEQTPTDPDDTDTSDEGTEQTPTDPDDTDTSDEETATDPDDTDTSDEETPDTPAEEPTEPETPVEEPTEPDTPAEEPTDPEEPPVVEEPTEPDTPTEEPTVPETPEQLPAEEIQEIPVEPLAAGDLTITLVDENGGPLGNETASISAAEFSRWTDVDKNIAPQIDNYQFEGAYFETDEWTWTGYQRVKTYVAQLRYNDGEWQYKESSSDWWGSRLNSQLYFEYSSNLTGETGYFFIRVDGTIPFEPAQYQAGAYSIGIKIDNAVAHDSIITDNDTTKDVGSDGYQVNNDVFHALNFTPSVEQIQAALSYYETTEGTQYPQENTKEFNINEYYILWYVQKKSEGANYLEDGGKRTTNEMVWHIDGVLLRKGQISIAYDANIPEEATGVDTGALEVPLGYQVNVPTDITVGASGSPNGNVLTPFIEGYTFMGWNTRRDGTGDPYDPGDSYHLAEDTMLYAMWVPDDSYILRLHKVDGLGEPLSGANFTISEDYGASEEITIGSGGTYTDNTIQVNTRYTIRETFAPTGYQLLETPFSFELESTEGGSLEAVFYGQNGEVADWNSGVPGVVFNYNEQLKTIDITVTNIGYFYIFYSSDCSVKEVPIDGEPYEGNWNGDGTYNIVNEVHDTYLYGGYYSDYAGKGDYQDGEGPTSGSGNYNYTGDQTSWDSREAYNESGFAMTPEAGTTYYLKEVPNTYLHPATYVVYDTHDSNQIVDLYLLTATDDANYSSVGFDVTGTAANEIVTLTTDRLYEKVEVRRDGALYQTLEPTEVFKEIPAGLLALSTEKSDYIVEKANYVEAPYFVTLDGVKVTGNQNLKVYLRNCHYVDGWKLPGITKIAQSKDIVNGAAN